MSKLTEEMREFMAKLEEVQKPSGFDNWSTHNRLIWLLVEYYDYSKENALIKAEEIEEETFANSEIFKSFYIDPSEIN